ncbi:type I-E CRISPR-associated endoribonuclease Cas2e [Peptostreptococcus stomatis]|uniref:type I-E CRISPR-associated endoribonuclease Cas2e n=1 Tax=Peptostreptococcus stomatis TaxID=341694 RepID=UPI0026EAE7DA|nr:type I-E CRISPR-associated endoribonuclease Cas2e [Peptostreptococcus stomatis]
MALAMRRENSMPFTVITVKNVPKSLRGDLTKWMQEIATGVYVGNFNSKVREQLWNRVLDSIDGGEATISYSYRNEIGYSFNTINAQRKVVDLDGVPLVLLANTNEKIFEQQKGYSDASKIRKSRKFSNSNCKNRECNKNNYLILYITTVENTDNIETICSYKEVNFEEEYIYITLSVEDKKYIINKTGITNTNTYVGVEPLNAIEELSIFLEGYTIVSYGLSRELEILSKKMLEYDCGDIYDYKIYDLEKFVKKDNLFLEAYDLENVFKEYEIEDIELADIKSLTRGIYMLSKKVNKFLGIVNKE